MANVASGSANSLKRVGGATPEHDSAADASPILISATDTDICTFGGGAPWQLTWVIRATDAFRGRAETASSGASAGAVGDARDIQPEVVRQRGSNGVAHGSVRDHPERCGANAAQRDGAHLVGDDHRVARLTGLA